ncbi:S-adenosyl-L-methionine-dependent methyltransferase [Mycotypha africana]|uniref:S-adenosyl-L-methionine-dependent methyltransferase n=1 Tax=Mycotypha africana TaxID=64632 RepID=UPI002300696D|nr:S-adenosyl-L-methionine-dependent methyltransferase [Mycotypha africana]KAI8970003.1 S-adenosyl-L-methionine-dependent methyltransferase [Mycotypha africana]
MLVKFSVLIGYLSCLPWIAWSTDGSLNMMLTYLHAVGVCILLYVLFFASATLAEQKTNDLYGLRHILFNVELPPKTMWFNMGLWDKKGIRFPTACENLVHAVVSKMDMKAGSSVLDVGFGCGDSCILLAETYHCQVTGLTNELSQWKIAEKRVSSQEHLRNKIQLIHGSADNIHQWLPPTTSFDYILSIDSAYHYNTRWSFLKDARDKLNIGGVVGLYDLALDDSFANGTRSPFATLFLKCICKAMHVPIRNLVTVTEYKRIVSDLAYLNVQVQPLDRRVVFGGLANTLAQLDVTTKQYGIGVSLSNKLFLKASRFIFDVLAKSSIFIPIIVICRKEGTETM